MINTYKYLTTLKATGLSSVECFAKLTEELAITAKHYPEGITLLDYDMCDSPKMHPIVIECRSLILETETFECVSKKFNRFFNYGECPEFYSDFNWQSANVMEKADGSLIGIYNYNGTWYVSTRGMAFAEGNTQLNDGSTFRDGVMDAFGFKTDEEFQNFMDDNFHKNSTLIFEYTSPFNRVVTPYTEPMMVLLGGTSNAHPLELEPNELEDIVEVFVDDGYNVRLPKMYPMSEKSDELVAMANSLTDLQEGFVVWDSSSGKRVKIKAATYLVAHSLRGNDPLPTKKNLLKLLFSGDMDEFLAYFPEWAEKANAVRDEVHNTLATLATTYESTKDIESQKDFAIAIRDVKHNGILFAARKTSNTLFKVFYDLDVEKKIRMFLD